MVESAQRVVPGAPPSQVKTVAKKKKQQQQQKAVATNGTRSHSQEAISRAANDASLMEKAPSHDKINDSVKIQVKDLAEEAERNGAIAAAQIVIEKENGGSTERDHKSALQVILTKRIKLLSKKLQRAIAYEALEEEKLNADMKRIIESRPALEAGVAELTEASKALEIAEEEADQHAKAQTKLAVEAAQRELVSKSDHKSAILFQFLHLYSLTQLSSVPSFAPPPMPVILAQATAQEVAAVGKLYADLSSSTEVVAQDVKNTLVEKLASGSQDSILVNVSFERILSLIEGLSNPVVEQPEAEKEANVEEKTVHISSQSKDAAPTPGGILFMQESELDDAPLEAAEEVKQAEPEGGAMDGIPSSEIKGGATERGQAGAKGTILGDEAAISAVKEDGSARAQVDEPVQTIEVSSAGESSATMLAAQLLDGAGPKSVDWANDNDDDWGDLMMQPSSDPKSGIHSASSEARKVNGMSNGSAKKEQNKQQPVKGSTYHQQEQRNKALSNGPQTASAKASVPSVSVPKSGPEMDDDGFIVASSKRSKMLQQHQQQQQQQQQMNRNANRGGRGAYRGQGGRGNGFSQRGNTMGDNRGRGRGRGGGRPGAEQSSEA